MMNGWRRACRHDALLSSIAPRVAPIRPGMLPRKIVGIFVRSSDYPQIHESLRRMMRGIPDCYPAGQFSNQGCVQSHEQSRRKKDIFNLICSRVGRTCLHGCNLMDRRRKHQRRPRQDRVAKPRPRAASRTLFRHPCLADKSREDGPTKCLQRPSSDGACRRLRFLVQAGGASLLQKNKAGWTPLMQAVAKGDLKMVR